MNQKKMFRGTLLLASALFSFRLYVLGQQTEMQVCGAHNVRPPCDHFKVIDLDLDKWADGGVAMSKGNTKFFIRAHRKSSLFAAWGGNAYHVYKANSSKASKKWPYRRVPEEPPVLVAPHSFNSAPFIWFRKAAALLGPNVDLEFNLHAMDQSQIPRKSGVKCKNVPFTFSAVSDSRSCDVAWPAAALRPVQPMHLISPSTATLLSQMFMEQFNMSRGWKKGAASIILPPDKVPMADKRRVAYFRGQRNTPAAGACRDIAANNARDYLVKNQEKDFLDAKFSTIDGSRTDEMYENRPYTDNYNHAILPVVDLSCRASNRLIQYMTTKSVVALLGEKRFQRAFFPIQAALEDGTNAVICGQEPLEKLRAVLSPAVTTVQLEKMSLNANKLADWALSDEGIICYLLELLTKYKGKMNYKPSESGLMKNLIDTAKRVAPDWNIRASQSLQKDGLSDAQYVKIGNQHFILERYSLEDPDTIFNSDWQTQCKAFKARRPEMKKVIDFRYEK
jgi:hypothetical protein